MFERTLNDYKIQFQFFFTGTKILLFTTTLGSRLVNPQPVTQCRLFIYSSFFKIKSPLWRVQLGLWNQLYSDCTALINL